MGLWARFGFVAWEPFGGDAPGVLVRAELMRALVKGRIRRGGHVPLVAGERVLPAWSARAQELPSSLPGRPERPEALLVLPSPWASFLSLTPPPPQGSGSGEPPQGRGAGGDARPTCPPWVPGSSPAAVGSLLPVALCRIQAEQAGWRGQWGKGGSKRSGLGAQRGGPPQAPPTGPLRLHQGFPCVENCPPAWST